MIHNKLTEADLIYLKKKFEAFDKLLAAHGPALGYTKIDPTLFAYFHFKNDKLEPFKALPWQDKFLNSKKKRNLLNCSRQIGKSTVTAIKALHRAFYNPGFTILVVSKTKGQAVELVYKMRKFLNTAQHKIIWKDLAPSGKENKHEIILKGLGTEKIESRIIVVPATDASLGFSANYVICDEFARWEDGDRVFLEDIEPTTFWTDGDIDILSTPAGKQGLFYQFFNQPEIWEIFHYDWQANPKNTLKKMEEKKKTHTPMSFAMNFEAKFVAAENAYFTIKEIQSSIKEDAGQGYRGETAVMVGVDFGKVHDACVIDIVACINPDSLPNQQIYRLIDRREKPLGTDYAIVLEELKSINKLIKPLGFMLDTTSGDVPSDILASEGLPATSFKFTIYSKIQIMNNIKILMQQGRLQIPNEKKLIEQLEVFEYKISDTNSDRMMLHAPSGYHDDEVDALALACYGFTDNLSYLSSSFIPQGIAPDRSKPNGVFERSLAAQAEFLKKINFSDI